MYFAVSIATDLISDSHVGYTYKPITPMVSLRLVFFNNSLKESDYIDGVAWLFLLLGFLPLFCSSYTFFLLITFNLEHNLSTCIRVTVNHD